MTRRRRSLTTWLLVFGGVALAPAVWAQPGPVTSCFPSVANCPLRLTISYPTSPAPPANATYSPTAPSPKPTVIVQIENVSGGPVYTVEGFSESDIFRRLIFVREEDGATFINKSEEQIYGHNRLYHCFSRQQVLTPVATQVVPAELLPGPGGPTYFREYVIDDVRRPEFYDLHEPGRYRFRALVPFQWFDATSPAAFINDCDQFEGVTVVNVGLVAGRFQTILESNTLELVIEGTVPGITIASPPDHATYGVGQSVIADYACADAGAGLDTCQGPVPDGAAIDTATPGAKIFTVLASDLAGNTRSVSVGYTVLGDATPPELAARCAPPGKDPAVTGRNGGVASLTSNVPGTPPFNRRETFTVSDPTGNRLVAPFGVQTSIPNATTFSLQSLTYDSLADGGDSTVTPAINNLTCAWTMAGGNVTALTQNLLLVGSRVDVIATYDRARNQTTIRVLRPGQPIQTIIRPGVVFLSLTTNQGAIGLDF